MKKIVLLLTTITVLTNTMEQSPHEQANQKLLDAAYRNNPYGVKAALNAGADVNIKDEKEQTPLYYAAHYRDNLILKQLLEIPTVNVNVQNTLGFTPLANAVMVSGNLKGVKMLLDKGANPNVQDLSGETTLIYAMRNEHINESTEMVKELLDAGADTNIKNIKGNAPLQLAIKRWQLWGHNPQDEEIIKALIQAGAKLSDLTIINAVKNGQDELARILQSAKKTSRYEYDKLYL